MDSTQAKTSTSFGLHVHKAAGNIFVPVIGIILLLIVALQYSRSTEGLSRLALAAITTGVAVIGLSYYKIRRGLNQLDGRISDTTLSSLYLASYLMAMFGYLICIMATLVHH
jgi:uncharacterized membrane protein YidH (DUF202 family)